MQVKFEFQSFIALIFQEEEVAKAPCLSFAVKQVLTSVFSTEEMTRCSVMGHRNIKVRDKKGLDVYKRSEIEHKLLGHYISFVGHLELLKIQQMKIKILNWNLKLALFRIITAQFSVCLTYEKIILRPRLTIFHRIITVMHMYLKKHIYAKLTQFFLLFSRSL